MHSISSIQDSKTEWNSQVFITYCKSQNIAKKAKEDKLSSVLTFAIAFFCGIRTTKVNVNHG